MRFHFGDFPRAEGVSPEPQGWQAIRSFGTRQSYLMAALAGVALLSGLCIFLSAWSLAMRDSGWATAGESATPWATVLLVLVVYVPLHELLHLLGQPELGRSSRSVVVLWPTRLRFGVYYDGCMSRRRWLMMRLAPLIALSVLPAGLLALSQVQPLGVELEIGLQVLMIVNALGSGGDVIAALLVIAQVPPTGQLCFREGRAYWRPAECYSLT